MTLWIPHLHINAPNYTYHFQFSLYLSQLPSGKHLDVWAHLFPSSRFACAQLDVSGYQLITACNR